MAIACYDPYTGDIGCAACLELWDRGSEEGLNACCGRQGLLYSYGTLDQSNYWRTCDDPVHTTPTHDTYIFDGWGFIDRSWWPYIGEGNYLYKMTCLPRPGGYIVHDYPAYYCAAIEPTPQRIQYLRDYAEYECGYGYSKFEFLVGEKCGQTHWCCINGRCQTRLPSSCRRMGGITWDGTEWFLPQWPEEGRVCVGQTNPETTCQRRPCCRTRFYYPDGPDVPGYPPDQIPYSVCDIRLPENCVGPPNEEWTIPDLPFAQSCYFPHACAPVVDKPCIKVRFALADRPMQHLPSAKGSTPGYLETVSERLEAMEHDELGASPASCRLQYGDLSIGTVDGTDYVMGAVCVNDTPWDSNYNPREHTNWCPWTVDLPSQTDGYVWLRCGYRFWRN